MSAFNRIRHVVMSFSFAFDDLCERKKNTQNNCNLKTNQTQITETNTNICVVKHILKHVFGEKINSQSTLALISWRLLFNWMLSKIAFLVFRIEQHSIAYAPNMAIVSVYTACMQHLPHFIINEKLWTESDTNSIMNFPEISHSQRTNAFSVDSAQNQYRSNLHEMITFAGKKVRILHGLSPSLTRAQGPITWHICALLFAIVEWCKSTWWNPALNTSMRLNIPQMHVFGSILMVIKWNRSETQHTSE